MTLLALQRDFQAFVRDPAGRGEAIARRLATPPDGDGRRRLGVYHHAYRARLGEVLREVFDKTWTYLGDEAFALAVDDYVARQPSASPSLDDYGAAFPARLEALWPAEPDVAELAWLDWSMRRVFDGPDAAALDAGVLRGLDGAAWDRVGFVLHPTLTMRMVLTNAGGLWAGLADGAPPVPAALEAAMAVRVWRKDLQPHFRTIDLAEAGALSRVAEGLSFAEVCEALGRDGLAAPVDRAAGMLAAWLEDGLIVGLRDA